MCSDVGCWETAMLSYMYLKDWWTADKLPLTHLVTAITLLITFNVFPLISKGNRHCVNCKVNWVTIPIKICFVSFVGEGQVGMNWPVLKKVKKKFWSFLHPLSIFLFLLSKEKKRFLVLIIVVAWVWFNTSEVTPPRKASRNRHPAWSGLSLPLCLNY